jgi:hypothetical protein
VIALVAEGATSPRLSRSKTPPPSPPSHEVSDRLGQAYALNDLGVVQRLTGDDATAASHTRALKQFRDLGDRPAKQRR